MNYVCPYCFNALNKCTCKLYPPYHLIMIDKNIQEHIRILNEKGYKTMYCCEGHGVSTNTYIAFAMNYFSNINAPDGFKYDKKKTIITYSYPSKLTKEEAKELKQKKLELLLEWCKSLPNINENVEN